MKDIYELFNDLDVDFSDIDEIEVNDLDRKKGKKKLMFSIKKRNSNRKKVIAAASTTIIVISAISIVQPTWAQNLPIVGGLIQRTFFDSSPQYENYINVIGQTNSHNGVDVTFENAIADKNSLFISFVVKDNNKPIEHYVDALAPMIMKVNGEEVNMSGSADGEKIDDNTVRILQTIDWNLEKLPNKLDIELLDDEQNLDIKFSMDTKEIENSTVNKKIDKNIEIKGQKCNVEELTISPITTKLNYYVEQDEDEPYLNFLVFDQGNNELKFNGGRSTTKGCKDYVEGRIDYSMKYISTSKMSKLTFIPIEYGHKDNPIELSSQKVKIDNFKTLSFKITDNIVLVVESLDRDNDKITIKYNYYYKNKKLSRVDGGNLFVKNINMSDEYVKPLDEIVDDECNTITYSVIDENEIEIGCYDTLTNKILEDKAFSIDIK